MDPAGFEPTIPASERPQTHALDRAATGIGFQPYTSPNHQGSCIKQQLFRLVFGRCPVRIPARVTATLLLVFRCSPQFIQQLAATTSIYTVSSSLLTDHAKGSRVISVGIATTGWTIRYSNRGRQEIFLSSDTSRLVFVPTQPPTTWAQQFFLGDKAAGA
jgi:hypothetical protein